MINKLTLSLALFLALGSGYQAQAADIDFPPLLPDQRVVFIDFDGDIVKGDAEHLKDQIVQARRLERADWVKKEVAVIFTSSGGDWEEAMAVGRVIRDANVDTYHNYCAFACVLAYLGGERRLFSEKRNTTAALVVSRPVLLEGGPTDLVPQAKLLATTIRSYIVQQTRSAQFANFMLTISTQSPRTLSAQEAFAMNVSTEVLQLPVE
jgi:hypothetical protein